VSQANEPELILAIQKELIRLNYYEGPITDKWSRPVRSAVRAFLRKTGGRARSPQPTAWLLTALQATESVKKQAPKAPEGARPEEKPIRPSEPVVVELPSQQNAAASVPAAQNDDYLPPWMTAKADQARFASNSEAARSDEPVEIRSPELGEAPSSFDDTSKRHLHRRRHAERLWKGRHVSHRGYYSRRRAFSFPF
jgi:peptidoglycan hydrolase-like protein with peptidoglycan-binding domain